MTLCFVLSQFKLKPSARFICFICFKSRSDYKITLNVNYVDEVNNNKIWVNLLVQSDDFGVNFSIIKTKTVQVWKTNDRKIKLHSFPLNKKKKRNRQKLLIKESAPCKPYYLLLLTRKKYRSSWQSIELYLLHQFNANLFLHTLKMSGFLTFSGGIKRPLASNGLKWRKFVNSNL